MYTKILISINEERALFISQNKIVKLPLQQYFNNSEMMY